MKLKLRTKLLLGFICVSLIGGGIGILGVVELNKMADSMTVTYKEDTQGLGYIAQIGTNFQAARAALFKATLARNTQDVEKALGTFAAALQAVAEGDKGYPETYSSKDDEAMFNRYLTPKTAYVAAAAKVVDLLRQSKPDEAAAVLNDQGSTSISAMAAETQNVLNELIKSNLEAAETNKNQSQAESLTAIIIMTAITISGVVLSIILGIWLGVFAISRPLIKLSKTLQAGSEQISAASNQLASSAQQIANGATEQASSVEETSASMEELSSMVKQNLANSKEASQLAEKASAASQEGFQDMNLMVNAMQDIAKSSGQVGKVIKLIEDISFQTNILALNAAVEAARAGEAGLGFAVVADEVKNLANRSADAAKETAQMIEDAIRKTEEGAGIANRLAEAFKGILGNSQKVAAMAKEVEVASTQQDAGINQVTKAIVQFDEVVQANASTAEESSSAAEELSGQSVSLMHLVQDLTKLVNGQVDTANSQSDQAVAARVHMPIAHANRVSHKPLLTGRTGMAPRPKARELTPEAIIPFEDDEELKNL